MTKERFIIPISYRDRYSFESTVVEMCKYNSMEWGIQDEVISNLRECQFHFEYQFREIVVYEMFYDKYEVDKLLMVWQKLEVALTELYENYLVNNNDILSGKKKELGVMNDDFPVIDKKISIRRWFDKVIEKKRIIFFFVFLQISYIVFAETQNYLPGYIITIKQDTVYGEINFKTDVQNAKECRFRLNDNAKEELYLPGDIAGYRFSGNGKYYVSRKITIDGKESTVFLEYLIQGLLNVYYYSLSDVQSYYFFEKEDGSMEMITKDPEKIVDYTVLNDKRYDGKLRYYFQNYIPKEYSNKLIDYNQKNMIDIAKNYHHALCTTGGECIVFENQQPDAKVVNFSFGLYAGLDFMTYIIHEIDYFAYPLGYVRSVNNVQVPSVNPMIGAVANMLYPRWSKSFSLFVDMSLTKMTASKKYSFENTVTEPKLGGYMFAGKAGIKYKYPKYRLQPVLEASLGYTGFIISNSAIYYHYTSSAFTSENYVLKKDFFQISGSVGFDYKLDSGKFVTFLISPNLYSTYRPSDKNGFDRLRAIQMKLGYIF